MIKKMMTEAYEAPMVEVLDIAVEQGFAGSVEGGIDDVVPEDGEY